MSSALFRGNQLKVMHLMGSLRPSGMERMFLSAAPYLADLGVQSTIIGQGEHHTFVPELALAGYRVTTIASLRTPRGVRDWFRVIRSERPDIVHIHTEGAFASSVQGARWASAEVPVVRTVHNVFAPSGKARLSRVLQGRMSDPWVSDFIAVSPDVQDNERRFNRECRLILNWVDDKFFAARGLRAGNETARPSAVIVGNPSPIKNHLVALRAVKKAGCDLYYHGDEAIASAEEKSILDELAAAGRIRYRGVGDPTTSLKHASVFLLPSKHEGMPIALSEALVVGVPAIVNDVPGVQWARDFPNVHVVGEEQDVWDTAVFAATSVARLTGPDMVPLPLNLSARRGAEELSNLYRSHAN